MVLLMPAECLSPEVPPPTVVASSQFDLKTNGETSAAFVPTNYTETPFL